MFGWLYLTCVLVLLAVVLDWYLFMRKRRYFTDLPTYPRLPFIGNLHKFFGNSENFYHKLSEISTISEKTQKPFIFWVGSKPLIVFHDPEMVKRITNGYADKPYYYSFANLWLGEGLFTAPATVWKRNIKKLGGTFTGSVVEGYQDIFNAQAQRLVDKLKTRVGQESFDVTDYLAITTLETICQTALGVSRISEAIVTKEYYEAFSRTFVLVLHRAINIFMHSDFLYKLSPGYSEMKKNLDVLHKVSNTIMKRRQTEREILKRNELENNNAGDTKTKFKSYYDILSEMKEADPTLTEKKIRDEIDTIILAGQETVAMTLLYTILMIGCKPDVQNKLHSEIQSIFGDSKRPVTKQDLSRMEYCEAVINEAMRLYPPVPAVLREADHDIVFESCTIPRGAGCVLNIFGAGRSESLWGSDAADFKPERWLNGGAMTNPIGFYPFSYGKRACIGKKYAIPILKTILAYVTRELVIQSEADKLKLKIELSLKPASGNLMKVFLRE